MRKLAVIPMYANGKAHGKPLAYEVHDVTNPHLVQFPEVILTDHNGESYTIGQCVSFETEQQAQEWINTHDVPGD